MEQVFVETGGHNYTPRQVFESANAALLSSFYEFRNTFYIIDYNTLPFNKWVK